MNEMNATVWGGGGNFNSFWHLKLFSTLFNCLQLFSTLSTLFNFSQLFLTNWTRKIRKKDYSDIIQCPDFSHRGVRRDDDNVLRFERIGASLTHALCRLHRRRRRRWRRRRRRQERQSGAETGARSADDFSAGAAVVASQQKSESHQAQLAHGHALVGNPNLRMLWMNVWMN